ncbi:MAG: hypothetical protein ACRDOH_03730 [Streptosporangiaceae bacterium]
MASSGRPLAIATVIAWVLTASIGVYMLHTWVARGGLRRQRATGVGVPPAVVFGHASAALTGLAIWIGFLETGWDPLAWLGVTLVAAAIALGLCTVTLWTPYPVIVPPPGGEGAEASPGGEGGPGGGGGPGGLVPPVAGGSGGSSGSSPRADTEITDEMIASLLADPFPARRRPGPGLVPLIPVVHGFAALTTFMLAVLTAISARLGMFRSQ